MKDAIGAAKGAFTGDLTSRVQEEVTFQVQAEKGSR